MSKLQIEKNIIIIKETAKLFNSKNINSVLEKVGIDANKIDIMRRSEVLSDKTIKSLKECSKKYNFNLRYFDYDNTLPIINEPLIDSMLDDYLKSESDVRVSDIRNELQIYLEENYQSNCSLKDFLRSILAVSNDVNNTTLLTDLQLKEIQELTDNLLATSRYLPLSKKQVQLLAKSILQKL